MRKKKTYWFSYISLWYERNRLGSKNNDPPKFLSVENAAKEKLVIRSNKKDENTDSSSWDLNQCENMWRAFNLTVFG